MKSTRAGTASRWGRYVLGVAFAATLLAVAIPSLSGVAWSDVSAIVTSLPARAMFALAGLWLLGLLAHTIALTAALPGLTHRRALTLSLTGSAVSNVLPLGGAAGVALNYKMVRTWGFDRPQFAAYTVVTNLWDVLAKMLLPVLTVPLLLLTGTALPGRVLAPGIGAVVGLALFTILLVASISSAQAAARVGAAADFGLNAILRRFGSRRRVALKCLLVDTQHSCRRVIASGWARLSLGMVLYTGLLYILLSSCLHLAGAGVGPGAIVAGFTVERLLTLATITPGGAGVVEVGLSGVLLLLGGDPAGVVAGVLLYRLLTFGFEIPVGGTGLAAWLWLHRRNGPILTAETAGI